MGTALKDYLTSVERALQNRTGIDCLSERPAQEQLVTYDLRAEVTPDTLSHALARALTCLQTTLKVSVRCPLPPPGELSPENVAKMLTRMAGFRYRPDPPRPAEWTSDKSLEQNLRLVYREHLQGILEHHVRVSPASPVYSIVGSAQQVQALATQTRFCCQIMRPGVFIMVADILKSVPGDRRAQFLLLASELLASLEPEKEYDPEIYQRMLAQCQSLANPSPSQGAVN